MFYKLIFIHKGNGLCASDLKKSHKEDLINIQQISSISGVLEFHLPLSGEFVSDYVVVTMQNLEKYYITPASYQLLVNAVSDFKVA